MNILSARTEHTRARKMLLADYTDQNLDDYTTVALSYSDHRARALWAAGTVLAAAGFAAATSNMALAIHGGGNTALSALTIALTVASLLAYKLRLGVARNAVDDINATALIAEYEAAPTDVLLRRLPPETRKNR